MSYTRHDLVIAVCHGHVFDPRLESMIPVPDIEAFRASLPERWRPLVIGPIRSVAEFYLMFVFLPDGSKEGWPDSDEGDRYRNAFGKLFDFQHSDGSSPFDVLYVRYGGSGARTVMTSAVQGYEYAPEWYEIERNSQ